MRLICGVVGIVGAGVFAFAATAVDLPPLPVPIPPVPTLPVPLPVQPIVPAPTVPTPTVPTPTVPTPTVPTSPAPSVAPAPQPEPQPQSTTAPATAAAPANASPPPTYAAAPRQTTRARRTERAHILVHFRLVHAGRLVVTVRELAPVCRELGHYRVAARSGRNTLHVPARITKPGSYAFVGRAHGRKVFTIEARIAPGRRVLRVLARATETVCSAPVAPVASVVYARTTAAAPQIHVKSASKQLVAPKVAASPVIRAISLEDAPASVRPFLFALLALAIVLLATAAAPQRLLPAGRPAALVMEQRVFLAAAGIGLVVAVAVATAFA